VTRSQATIIAILLGFVILVCIAAVAVLVYPFEEMFLPAPTATITPLPPTVTPTATFPNFLPTASSEPPLVTATNTRLPTATPSPERTATATVVIDLNYPAPRHTATPLPSPTPLPGPVAPTVTPAGEPTRPTSRQYTIFFEARQTRIDAGECTLLQWRVDGALNVTLNGKRVSRADQEEVCPSKDTAYVLRAELPDGAAQSRSITIFVVK
jgi:hypothetical protein